MLEDSSINVHPWSLLTYSPFYHWIEFDTDYVIKQFLTFLYFLIFSEKLLDSVLNISVAYPKTMPIGEFDVFTGNFPEEIHFHVNSTPVVDFPTSSDDLVNWCQNRWSEKEEQLRLYYEKREFSPFEKQDKDMIYDTVETYSEESVRRYLYKVVAFWCIFIILVFYSLFEVSLFRWYSLFSIIAFSILERKYGGLDTIQFLYDFWWFYKVYSISYFIIIKAIQIIY